MVTKKAQSEGILVLLLLVPRVEGCVRLAVVIVVSDSICIRSRPSIGNLHSLLLLFWRKLSSCLIPAAREIGDWPFELVVDLKSRNQIWKRCSGKDLASFPDLRHYNCLPVQ